MWFENAYQDRSMEPPHIQQIDPHIPVLFEVLHNCKRLVLAYTKWILVHYQRKKSNKLLRVKNLEPEKSIAIFHFIRM
jgi:hypothetical protein